MATKMVYVCSCGSVFNIEDATDVESHLDSNTTHTVAEGLAHSSATGVPQQLPVEASDGTIYRLDVGTSGGMAMSSDSGLATKLPKSQLGASADPSSSNDSTEGYEPGSRWLNTTTGEEFVCFNAAATSAVWGSTTAAAPVAGVWGADAVKSESLPLSISTSTGWRTKLVLTVVVSATGTYRIGWSYGWSADITSYDFRARLLDHNATQVWGHRQEPKDSGGTGSGDWKKTGTDQLFRSSGVLYLNLSAGSHTLTLQWCSSSKGNEASIWDAVLEAWRHS